MKKYETEFEVVGTKHYLEIGQGKKIKRGIPLKATLEREPDNPVDGNAIAVRIDDLKIGHLRRGVAKVLAPEIDKGKLKVNKAKLVEFDPKLGVGTVEVWLEKRKN